MLYLLSLLNRCPGLHCYWPEVPHAHLSPHCQTELECLDLHCDPHKRDLTHRRGEGRTGVSLRSRRNKWTEISLELQCVRVRCVHLSFCTCLRLPGAPPHDVILLLSCSCLLVHAWKAQTLMKLVHWLCSKWKTCEAVWIYLQIKPGLSPFSERVTNKLVLTASRKHKCDVTLTCRRLQLFVFLFPPFPGLEDASQAGQLTVAADGRSTNPWDQAARMQHPLLVHHIYNTQQKSCLKKGCRQHNPPWAQALVTSVSAPMGWGHKSFLKELAQCFQHPSTVSEMWVTRCKHLIDPSLISEAQGAVKRRQRIALFVRDLHFFMAARPSWPWIHGQYNAFLKSFERHRLNNKKN